MCVCQMKESIVSESIAKAKAKAKAKLLVDDKGQEGRNERTSSLTHYFHSCNKSD